MNSSTASPNPPSLLAPRSTVFLLVVLVHLLVLGGVAWWVLPAFSTRVSAQIQTTETNPSSATLRWLHPSAFRVPNSTPPPFVLHHSPPASVSQEPPQAATSQASRFITLSRRNILPLVRNASPTAPAAESTTLAASNAGLLPDKNLYSELDRIDEAIHQAFMQVWQPPASKRLAATKRSARLDLSLSHSLEIDEADLVSPSGSPEFDLSILDAVDQVRQLLPSLKSGAHPIKIPQSLPSTFQNLRYDCRIQFQIE